MREYVFSDEGQINFAKGFARPILIDYITLPPEVAANVLPKEQYAKARPMNATIVDRIRPRRCPRCGRKQVMLQDVS